jgi:hypothetical protein
MLHTKTVNAATLDLIRRLMADAELKKFYLVGGTALALKTGHRISIDIDLFTDIDFDSVALANYLAVNYEMEIQHTEKNTIISFIENVKADLIAHKYPLIREVDTVGDIRMLSLEDIGAMKLNAIIQNGTRLKDFVDVYFLLERHSLNELITAYEFKYGISNAGIIKKALLFHDEIDFKTEVILREETRVKWSLIAKRLQKAVKQPGLIFVRDSKI